LLVQCGFVKADRLLAAVYLGFFDWTKFRTNLYSGKPDLGEPWTPGLPYGDLEIFPCGRPNRELVH